MKKILVLLVVLAMVAISSMAFATDISVSGMMSVRSRDFDNLTFDKNQVAGKTVDTQEKIRLEVNAKASDDLRGKLSIENYWDSFGRFENYQASGGTAAPSGGLGGTTTDQSQFLKVREAWINFNIPGIPVNVNVGHQLLALGNKWFLRSMYFGSDAWVAANVTGPNTFALVDIKVAEGSASIAGDDVDAYALLDVYKINENHTVGIDVANVKVRTNQAGAIPFDGLGNVVGSNLINVGLNYKGKLGPVNLEGEADIQSGKVESTTGGAEPKFKGNQIVVQGNVAVNPVTINFTLARGSGQKSGDTDIKQFITFQDIDTHYTYLYEYKIKTAAGAAHTGFSNTTAISAGVAADVVKSLNIGLDIWYLQATEKITSAFDGSTSSAMGTEVDGHVNWKLYDNLSWNWQLSYFKPGDGYKKLLSTATVEKTTDDAATGIQGYLTYKF
ncbi:MAG: alginate export family protein [Nitrospirota bacterium]